MDSRYKIAVVGIGGVGGFVGGKLAGYYAQSGEIEIAFVVRGENERIIKESGLKLITPEGESIVRPSLVTSFPRELGPVDLFICCVKNYHLEETALALKPCIKENSLFLPLLNGIDATDRIRKIIPGANVLEGCIYLVSRLIAPGVVVQSGVNSQVWFGSGKQPSEEVKKVETILRAAGINATLTENISTVCWEKFFFISTIATLTSYLNVAISEVIRSKEYKAQLLLLMEELKSVAVSKKISLPDDMFEKAIKRLSAMPIDATSSMHSDFKRGSQTELDSLTGAVIRLAKELNLSVPEYEKMYMALSSKTE